MQIFKNQYGAWQAMPFTDEEEEHLNFIFEALKSKYCPVQTDKEFKKSLRESSRRAVLLQKILENEKSP